MQSNLVLSTEQCGQTCFYLQSNAVSVVKPGSIYRAMRPNLVLSTQQCIQTCCCLQSNAVILLSTEPCCWICFNMSTELFSWTHYCQQTSAIKSATGYRAMQLNLLRCLRSREVKSVTVYKINAVESAIVYRAMQLNQLMCVHRCAVESATVYRAVQLNLLLFTELCSWIS